MLLLEALELALSKEKEAVKRYKGLEVEYPALKEIFNFLADEEMRHVKLIEEKISELIN